MSTHLSLEGPWGDHLLTWGLGYVWFCGAAELFDVF